MEQDFWHQRWSENQIGFHQEKVNSRLIKFWPKIEADAERQVFVPLCGKSIDMLWLLKQGFQVFGVELSSIACADFFRENGLEFSTSHHRGFEVFKSQGIELWAGDFFILTAHNLQKVNGIYDRAALIALPPEMRQRYAQHLAKILPDHCRMLCITMEYEEHKMKGPPFSVPDEEFKKLFRADFSIKQLSESSGPEIVGNLSERGLDTLTERVYLLRN